MPIHNYYITDLCNLPHVVASKGSCFMHVAQITFYAAIFSHPCRKITALFYGTTLYQCFSSSMKIKSADVC